MARHLLQRAGLHFWSENGEVTRQMCENWVAGLVAGGFGLGTFGWRWEDLEGGFDRKVLASGED